MGKLLNYLIDIFVPKCESQTDELIAVAKDGTTLFEKVKPDILWDRALNSFKDGNPFRSVLTRKSTTNSGSAQITDYTSNTIRTIDYVLPYKHETHIYKYDDVTKEKPKLLEHKMIRILPPKDNYRGEILTYNMSI